MRRKDGAALLLFFLLPLFFLSGTLTSNQTFFARDLTYLFHPWRTLSAQMLQAGQMPLWNPFEMGGMPLLANCQSAILYPFTLLFVHFHFVPALKLFHFFHFALYGAGFFLFGRRCGFGRPAALAGGAVFAYNGYMLTRLEFPSIVGTTLWLPWMMIFALASKDNLRTRAFYGVLCGLAMAFSLFSGFPQLLIFQLALAVLFSWTVRPFRETLPFWAVAGAAFLLLGAAQWLPTLELLPRSIRGGGGVAYDEAVVYSLPLDSLFGLISPFRILHHPDRFTGEKFFWIWSAWWGGAATLLAANSARFKNKKFTGFFALFGLAGVLWAMGDYLPWFRFLYEHVFFFRLFRYPPVSLLWAVSAAAALSMAGLEALKKSDGGRRKAALAGGVLLVLLELRHYSRHLLPTAPSDYFHAAFPAVTSVLQDRPGTAMISPRQEMQRRFAGTTDLEAKLRFRAYLFDLTNLPYRVRTLARSGEPLALRSYARVYDRLLLADSLEAARKTLNYWNVTHFLTGQELDATWTLIGSDKGVRAYRNPQAMGEAFAVEESERDSLEPKKTDRASELQVRPQKVFARFELKKN